MISNNPAFLQEQDFQAKHSDLLQAARKGKAWEPADNPRFGLCSQLVTSNWRYVSRIANIDISDVPDAESTARKYVSEAESPGLVELAECSTIRPSGRTEMDLIRIPESPVGTVIRITFPPQVGSSTYFDISPAEPAPDAPPEKPATLDPPRPPRYDSRCAGSGARVWWPSPRSR